VAFRKVIIAVDGSEPSEWAVEVGTSLAASTGGRVALVHIVDPSDPAALGAASPRGNGEAVRALRREGKRLLREMCDRVPLPLRDACSLREGHAADEILAAARDWGADVIVMGAHGRARLAPFLLGGTADAAARQAECPVIVVARRPRGSTDARADTARGAGGHHAPAASANGPGGDGRHAPGPPGPRGGSGTVTAGIRAKA
jgi:nucleotide-binding universal stress UspA family protein